VSAGRFDARLLLSIGTLMATGCHPPPPRTNAPTTAAPVEPASVEITPALAEVFRRVLWLPVMFAKTEYGPLLAEYFDNPNTTATDEQLADGRARASDCAKQIEEWQRAQKLPERAISIDGLPDGHQWQYTPEEARQRCEDLARRVGAVIQRREQGIENAATLVRWTKSVHGDRGDVLLRYGLPNAFEPDAHLADRFWVYTRRVFIAKVPQLCIVTYYFEKDRLTRTEAEPAACFASQSR
jgi:hypothetical protein